MGVLWAEEDLEGGSEVVILMRGLVIVGQGQLVHGDDEEVVVHSQMAVVMDDRSDVAGEENERLGGLLKRPQDAPPSHDHVQRLRRSATLSEIPVGLDPPLQTP